MTPAIDAHDLARVFRQRGGLFAKPKFVRAVDRISLSVPAGACLGIVGESGCGKSTLAHLILGLLKPTSGEVRVGGQRLDTLRRQDRARLIQPVFQDPFSSLNPRRRVRDIVAAPLAAQGVSAGERLSRVEDALSRVGLPPEIGERLPAALSGGQRQRVAIARALIIRPRIVVCDEPTSALDVSVQAQILNLLTDLRRELNLTIVFISHNLAVVEHICDEVAVMYLGRIVEQADTDALFRTPKHPYTRALLDSVLTPDPGAGLPDVGLGDGYPDPANIPTGCRFHPRCPGAQSVCRTGEPLRRHLVDRVIECFFATDETPGVCDGDAAHAAAPPPSVGQYG